MYQDIANKIVAAIQIGASENQMPWHEGAAAALGRPVNAYTDVAYRDVNVISSNVSRQRAKQREKICLDLPNGRCEDEFLCRKLIIHQWRER
jgi:hypothetical protein